MNDFLSSILTALLFVGGVGLLCSVLLVVASKLMAVKVDQRVEQIRKCLPGANCGACGFTGCDGYANALVNVPGTKTNLCIPGSDAAARGICEILGSSFEDVQQRKAIVRCNGTCGGSGMNTDKKVTYIGIKTCAAASGVCGGDGKCVYGCLGYGDCQKVCPADAVCIQDGIARINDSKCIGCGLCAKACPKHIITMAPAEASVAVVCSNLDNGAKAHKACLAACIGCKKCQSSCPHGAISVADNLSSIDYSLCTGCRTCVSVCPTHAIAALLPAQHACE